MTFAHVSPLELHHSIQCFSSWRASLCFLESKPCAWFDILRPSLQAPREMRPDLPHPSTIYACKNAPSPQPDTIPRPMSPQLLRAPTPLRYKVGDDVWQRFVCFYFFFAQHCSTDPVCLNPLDVTLMDYRGGVHGGGGASDRKCCAREAAEQREVNAGRVISSCRHVAGSKLIWCCYVTVIIILYNHISSFV